MNNSLQDKLLYQVNSSWIAQAVYVAVELGIAERLNTPKSVETLAEELGLEKEILHKLLRALIPIGILKLNPNEHFVLTEMGELLLENHPQTLRSWIIWWATNLWQPWGQLLYSIQTGASARSLLNGKEGFQQLEENSQQAEIFNKALVELTRRTNSSLLNVYDFSNYKKIIDIGGGYGELLFSVLKKYPSIQGALFDLQHAIQGVRKSLIEKSLNTHCDFIAGDFFKEIPKGYDAYVLKSIIHDWDDKKCKLILKNCHRAMTEHSKLLLVERMIPEVLAINVDHQEVVRSDLTMLVALGAGERTEKQFRNLLDENHFRVNSIHDLGMCFYLIEAEKGL